MNDRFTTSLDFVEDSSALGQDQLSSKRCPRRRVGSRNYSQVFKREKVQAFSQSGLSLQEFWAHHKLAYSTFQRWRQELSDVSTPQLSKKPKKVIQASPPQETPDFVSVLLAPLDAALSPETPPPSKEFPQRSAPSFMLHLGTGFQLSIPEDFHAPTLQRIVQTLCSDSLSR